MEEKHQMMKRMKRITKKNINKNYTTYLFFPASLPLTHLHEVEAQDDDTSDEEDLSYIHY